MIFSALIPPGNIIKELELYKEQLFRRFGTVSSRALPVLIPWITEPPADRVAVLRQSRQTGGILRREEGLFLEILCAGETPSPGPSPALPEKALPPPFQVPHLFLMDWQGEGLDVPPDLPEPPALSWQKGAFVTFELVTEPGGIWWEQVFLKEIL